MDSNKLTLNYSYSGTSSPKGDLVNDSGYTIKEQINRSNYPGVFGIDPARVDDIIKQNSQPLHFAGTYYTFDYDNADLSHMSEAKLKLYKKILSKKKEGERILDELLNGEQSSVEDNTPKKRERIKLFKK